MRVLVTGGAGFIGRHLVQALIKAGDHVVVLDNMRRAEQHTLPEGAELIEEDIRQPEAVRHAMKGCERIYHLAAQSNVMGAVSDTDYSFASNVAGTYHVLASAVKLGVTRVVFTSSREVYGEVDRLPVAEDRPVAPKNFYGASKAAGETYCQVFQATYGLDVNILRLANVTGPGDRDRVIPLWLGRAARGEDIDLFGGDQILDFIPVDVVVDALLRAGETSLNGLPVNIGSGKGTSLRDLAARIRGLAGTHIDIRLLPARSVEVTRFVADVERMRTLLGLEPPTDPLVNLPELWNAAQSSARR